MSESKARLQREADEFRVRYGKQFMLVVELLRYIHEAQQDYPSIPWPDLPDGLTESHWREAL